MSVLKLQRLLSFLLLVFISYSKALAQFANGADVGWLSEMEAYHYIFRDNSGNQKDCLQILKEKGINALRFRVWVNPSNKYCSKSDVTYMAQRAKKMGFDVMINFHMSDTWADPGNQKKPAAWAKHSYQELLNDVYNHVYDVLDTLKSVGVIPKWVQIGNETNDGMLWEEGRASTNMSNFAGFIKSGYNAVKAIDTTIQVIVHLSDAHRIDLYRWMFDGLKNNGAKWDIIGMSVYPYWANLPWAVDDSLALITMKEMISRYNTKVMVVETGYLYNKPIEANNFLIDLIEKTKSVGGLGVFYWEPQSYNWRGYKLGAWDPITKAPTVALDAFLGIKVTSVESDNDNIPNNYGLNIYPNPFNSSTTIIYEIPEPSNTSIIIYNLLGKEVEKLIATHKSPGRYQINWSAKNIPSGIYFCRLITDKHYETKKIILLK
ncbi:glycosyl hydrolase 53 family protein [Melioribacter sp. OK-6-Me]|uniref:glycosyl hydrolase 53 family protein n=1 Tax=unclassified Melioribacter TaxID=2627329 RepID=UPI003ED91292